MELFKGSEKMEENQTQFNGNEDGFAVPPVFACITAKTHQELIQTLNKRALDGYYPVWDRFEECETGMRVFVSNHDLMPEKTVVDENELAIIESLYSAGNYLDECTANLTDKKNFLLINTDYDIVNAERNKLELPSVKTAPEKKAWVDLQVKDYIKEENEAKRWFKYVEAMARKHQLPVRTPPWEIELEKEDAKATENVVVEK
jgi:hypothetical protein